MSWHRGDWLSFAQAAASIVAIAGAFGVVFLQNWLERRRSRARELERAKVVASAVTMKSAWYHGIVKSICKSMQAAQEVDCDPARFPYFAERLELLSVLSTEDVVSLEPLPNNCAHNFAAGLDRIEVARLLLVEFSLAGDKTTSEDRRRFAGRVAFVLNEANQMLESAVRECQIASFGEVHGKVQNV